MLTDDQERELVERGINAMEPLRRAARNAYALLWTVLVATAGGVWMMYTSAQSSGDPQPALVAAGIGAVIVLVLWAVAHAAGSKLAEAWDRWRAEVVRMISSEARYAPREYITSNEFDRTGLNTDGYNSYAGGDMLQVGTIRCCRLAVNRIETRYRTVTYTDAQGRTQTRQESYQVTIPVYHGVVLGVPVDLPHPGRLVVSNVGLPRNWQLKPVRVAHTGLTRAYTIGSYPTEFEGHRLLTPSLQVALWDFRAGLRTAPRVSYAQESRMTSGQMWLAAPDVYLTMGSRPGLWSTITASQLREVVSQCSNSIDWVRRAAATLQPN